MDYKNYELKEKRGIRWVNLEATITNEQSAFKGYTNSYSISNIKVQGIKALQYLKYQDFKLKQYLKEHKGMKVFLETFNSFNSRARRPTKRSGTPSRVEDMK